MSPGRRHERRGLRLVTGDNVLWTMIVESILLPDCTVPLNRLHIPIAYLHNNSPCPCEKPCSKYSWRKPTSWRATEKMGVPVGRMTGGNGTRALFKPRALHLMEHKYIADVFSMDAYVFVVDPNKHNVSLVMQILMGGGTVCM